MTAALARRASHFAVLNAQYSVQQDMCQNFDFVSKYHSMPVVTFMG